MIWNMLLFIITIGILVTVHEFGHFWIARRCGVKVERFSIGFGKKLWSYKTKNGTDFVISLIPLGGYVKMLDGRAAPLSDAEKPFAFNHKSIRQRAAIIAAGPIANFILAFVTYWIIFQIGVMTYPLKIAQILPESPAASVNIPQGSELISIAGIQLESWSDVNSALIGEMGKDSINISYINDGKVYDHLVDIRNWSFDIEKISSITAFGFVPAPLEIYPIISKIVRNSAAERAELMIGDEITGYNDQSYDNWSNFVASIKKGQPLVLTIKRGDRSIMLDLHPDINTNVQGIEEGKAGFYPTSNVVIKQYSIVGAISKALSQTSITMKLTIRSFYQLMTGVISLKNLSGPVSIAQGAGQSASYGIVPYLFFLAFISISLGIINLVPLPMLDGGHLIFLLIERIKGSPVSESIQEICYRFSFVLLMVIMGIALFNDFIRLSL